MHTKYFKHLAQVEDVFGRTLAGDEQEAILVYIVTGVRPDPGGCWHCNAAEMRRLTGWMDTYERMVEEGAGTFGTKSSEFGLPYGSDWD